MKLTKILAMLLALCMIVCCFAACGGKDDAKDDDKDEKVEDKDDAKDDDKDEDKDDDKDDDKGGAKDEDAELEGRWKTEVDLSGLIMDDFEGDYPELNFGITIEFRDDGNYTTTATSLPSVEDFADFFMAMYEEEGMTEEDAESEAESLLEEIKKDPRIMYGDYTVDGNVISLDEGYCDITFEIDGETMEFEEIKCDIDSYLFLKAAKFEKQ